jgi:ubiquinone/menaquinone biosynthesis C-methylase UbiE
VTPALVAGVGLAVGIAIGVLIYWLLVVTEGAYLGPRVVGWLYDRGASTYDGVKRFDHLEEAVFLAVPLFSRLDASAGPRGRVLDVATGTARLPLALLDLPLYEGEIVGVDLSERMLAEAAAKTAPYASRSHLLHHAAVPLPFADGSFDAVALLEALEFLPDRAAALAELVRVLAPGGWLLVTNRIGMDARLMPTRTDSPEAFERRLAALGLVEIVTKPWMTYYGLVFARKPGRRARRGPPPGPWHDALVCPGCAAVGRWRVPDADRLVCDGCCREVRAEGGVWRLRERG